jgi:hypothetical protein
MSHPGRSPAGLRGPGGTSEPVLAPDLLEGSDYRTALLQAAGLTRPNGGWVDTEELLRGAVVTRHGAAAGLLERMGVGPQEMLDALSEHGKGRGPE